jgi:hypothetical protein
MILLDPWSRHPIFGTRCAASGDREEGMMKLLASALVVLTLAPGAALAETETGFAGRPITNNLFAPTGYTLHKGEFTVGLGPVAFGITENVQLGTNLLLWIFQVYNADLKVAAVKDVDRALGLGIGVYRFSWDVTTDEGEEGDVEFIALGPYASASMRLSDNTMGHIAAQYSYFESDADVEDVEAEASASGTGVSGGLEYSMSNRTKFLADAGYDATFEAARFGGGVLFGWNTFRLKLGLSYFTAGDGFVFPTIGLWWRFRG